MVIKDIEVFRADDDFGIPEIDQIIKNYNPEVHEAPAVYGHPKTNSPAYGWVLSLQRKGQSLWARMNLLPELVQSIKKGLYKKRSIRVYTNFDGKGQLMLGHVGFLGGVAPAIKGMADIKFSQYSEKEGMDYSFDEENLNDDKPKGENTKKMEYTKEGVELEILKVKDKMENDFSSKLETVKKEFTDKVEALETEVDTLKVEAKAKDEEIKNLKKDKSELEVNKFVDKMIREGKVLTKDKKDVSEFLMSSKEFGDDHFEKAKKTYSTREKSVDFKEEKEAEEDPEKKKDKTDKEKEDFAKEHGIDPEDMKYDTTKAEL